MSPSVQTTIMAGESFHDLMSSLQGRSLSRDPRRLRFSSVVSAVVEVIKGEGVELSPLRVWKATISTLEGTLQSQSQELLDSVYTQASLLQLLRLVLPFLEPSVLPATINPTARALFSLRDSVLSLSADEAVGATLLATNDEVGCVPSVLCDLCDASATLLRCIACVPTDLDDRLITKLFRGTLRFLLDDRHDRVRKSARRQIERLLQMENPKCHCAILNDMNASAISALESISSSADPAKKCGEMMNLLDVVATNIVYLDFSKIGERQVGVIVSLIERNLTQEEGFILKKKNSSALLSVINVLLSSVLGIVEAQSRSEVADHFSGRVLATLLQIRPHAILQGADTEACSSGRELLVQIIISAAGRMLKYDCHKAAMLLPLTISQVFVLAADHIKSGLDPSISKRWFLHLGSILETLLPDIRLNDPELHSKCCESCLKAMTKSVLGQVDEWAKHGAFSCIAEILVQIDPQNMSAKEVVLELLALREKAAPGSQLGFALESAVLRIVQQRGIDEFWGHIDFHGLCLKANDRVEFSWLLNIFRQAGPPIGSGCESLSFFHERILPLARHYDSLAKDGGVRGKQLQQQAANLWALFPCFCVRPKDLATSLPNLAPILVRAMKDKRYPKLLIVISTGIDILAKGVFTRLQEIAELADEPEFAAVRSDGQIVNELAQRLLPTMFKLADDLFSSEHGDDESPTTPQGNSLSSAITSLAKLAPPSLLQSLFTKLIHRLLEASQSNDDQSERMCSLLSLSQALYTSQCLDEESVSLLYRALRPIIGTDETRPRVQKRSYKLLGELCKAKPFVSSHGRLKDLVELVTTSTSTSQVAARSTRLHCLELIVGSLGESDVLEQWMISSLLGEILLCLKDSNKRTREAALTLLLSVSNRCEDVIVLIRSIAAAIASETSHMRSAAVTAMSKVVHEHGRSNENVQSLIPSLLQTVLLLADDPSREVIKSMILFVRVSVTVCRAETIRPCVPAILEALLKYHEGKGRFREKIKIILKKLVKEFGHDHLVPLFPESDSHVLVYIKKLSKLEQKAAAKTKRGGGRAPETSIQEMMESDEEDSDDEQAISGSVTTGRTDHGPFKMSRKRGRDSVHSPSLGASRSISGGSQRMLVRNDASGSQHEVRELASRVYGAARAGNESDTDDEITFDDRGRLVLATEEKRPTNDLSNPPRNNSGKTVGGAAGTPRISGRAKSKSRALGDAYKSKKAGGDVKRKDQKYDPYAYVPLDGRRYAKKHRRHAVEQLDTVVRGSKKRQKR